MAGVSQEFGAVPLDLSIKQPPSSGKAPSPQGPQVSKALEDEESESKALDLTRSAGAVSFHRAIPVTTTVPSQTEVKKFGGLEKSRYVVYVQSEKVDNGKEKVCHVSPVVTAGSSQQVPSCTHSSVTGIRPKFILPARTKEEATTTVPGQTPERLSPSTLTYQQQSAMRNFVAMDTSEPHIPQRPASVGAPTVIVQNSLTTGYLIPQGRLPPVTAITPGTRMLLPNSELQRLNSLQSDRISRREDDEPPPSKAKAVEGRGRGAVTLHHFQPYPLPRPPTCIHRSLSIPSHSIPGRSVSPRLPMATDGSVSPGIVTGMHMSLSPHHVSVIPSRAGLATTPSVTANSSVTLTYSVLGKPKVASLQSTEPGNKPESDKSSKPEAAKSSQTPPVKESLQAFTETSAAAASKSESANQGSLPINPFYPLSVAVDCHRATAQDSDGDTPLHIAIVQEQPDHAYIQRLIQLVKMSGKSLDIFNYMQQTPLHLAAITNNIEVIRIMLEAGANPNEADRNGLTTVHHACCNRNSPCMAVIFKYSTFDIDLEKRNFNGHTPLHVAVEKGDKVLVRMLLEHNAKVNAMDSRNGWTPLFIAVANKDIKMLGILVEFGAKVNAQSYSGNSALHIATGRGYTDVVKVLVQYGADLSLKNSHWDTPVNVANANEMSQLLRGICRGSPNLSSSPSQSFARESSPSPVDHPYHGTYSPPPTASKPHIALTSHENVRNALSNKIHRRLSRDALTSSSPIDKGRESPIGRRKIKSTKVVSVPVDGDSFRLGQLLPMSEGNKIPVITKSGTPTQDSDAPVLSSDSGIGSWRVDSIPSIEKSTSSVETVKQETPSISEQVVTSSGVLPPGEDTMEFTVQTSKPMLSEGANVKVEKVSSIPMTSATSETYESMEVDLDPTELKERTEPSTKSPRSIAPRPVLPTHNAHLLMKTVDGGPFGLTHMFGLPVHLAPEVKGKTNLEVKSEVKSKDDSRGFDTTAVPVYRKAMQNGQQMSKSKMKVSPINSPSPAARPTPAPVTSTTVRQASTDSDDEGKLVIVEKGEMRTKPLKKTVSRSCPSSPSMIAKVSEKTGSPTPERTRET